MSMAQSGFIALGHAVMWMALLSSMFVRWPQKRTRIAVLCGLLIVMGVPVLGLMPWQWIRSAIGDISLLGMMVWADLALRNLRGKGLFQQEAIRSIVWLTLCAGVLLYPLALGLGSIDPYAWGFQPVWMVVVLVVLATVFHVYGMREVALLLLVSVIASHLHLLESANLWDYLLDPILIIYMARRLILNRLI